MINFFSYKIIKNYIRYFLILGWISCWVSLSFNPYKLFLIYENIGTGYLNKYNLFEFFDIIRGLFQIIYLPILIVFSAILFKKKRIFYKIDIFYLLFLTIFLIEIFSTIKLDNPNTNIYFTVSSINIVLTIFLLKKFFSENDIFLIFKLSILFLLILLLFYGTQYFIVAFKYGMNIYASWATVEYHVNYAPRPTGLARTALISFIFFINIKFFKKPYDRINYIIVLISIVLIILLSSRTIIFLYFLYLIFHIFYFKIYNSKNLLIFFKNTLLIPFIVIIIFGSFQQVSKNYIQSGKLGGDIFNFSTKDIARDYPEIKASQGREFSSGRLEDWKNILNSNENFLFGNGALGDRYLINQSASNLMIYTYTSSGLVGVLIITYISLIALSNIYKNIFVNRSKIGTYKFVASIIIIMLMMRSILETSYGIFGIDFILFCLCFTLIISNKGNNESN